MFKCKHCLVEMSNLSTSQKGNHTRWCVSNPKRSNYFGNPPKQFQTEEAKIKRSEGIKKAHASGKYTKEMYSRGVTTKKANGNHLHTEETKFLMSEKARASKHRRLMRNVRPYIKKDGSEILLDSSWEEALAKRLDELDIEWTRPLPIQYMDEDNKIRNYFPDFYLPAYNLFLDPKNPAAINAQKNKLDILKKLMNNLVIIDNLNDCQSYSPE